MKRLSSCLGLLAAALVALPALADTYIPGSHYDPRLRSADYLAEDQRNFSALNDLMRLNPSGDWQKMPPDYQWLLARSYLNFGMRAKSAPIYRSLAITATDHVALARARLRQAEFEYQRGYLGEARNTLYAMREKLPNEVLPQWQDLLSHVLMEDQRYGEAIEVLAEFKNTDRMSYYTQYNLGIALLNNGELQRGRELLDRAGRLRVVDIETLALRDKINNTLGWNFLRAQLGGTAKPIFFRVRSQGPFSNRALLGLGWSELSPKGERQRRNLPAELSPYTSFATLGGLLNPGYIDRFDAYNFERRNPRFRLGNISTDEQTALKRALAVWSELVSRDPMDPAVQEAWLAIPYALDRLGAHTEALEYYEHAVEELDKDRERIAAAQEALKQNRMVETIVRRDMDAESGWQWKLKDLPDAPETYYLQNLLAEHRFQEALKNYRDVRLMARNLEAWQSRLSEVEVAYIARPRGEQAGNPAELFARAKANWVPTWRGMTISTLRLEDRISAPGSFDEKIPPSHIPPTKLTLSRSPTRFNGPYERIQALRGRVGQLREQLALAGGDQAKLLEVMASDELEGQRKMTEKYLVEARFSLARLYDRAMKEGGIELPKKQDEKKGVFRGLLDYFGIGGGEAKPKEAPKKAPKK